MSELSQFSTEWTGRFDLLRVQGFRRLCDFSMELRPLCVLIGANGCGKTSILDVMSLLSASANGQLSSTISQLGGFVSIMSAPRSFTGSESANPAQMNVTRNISFGLRKTQSRSDQPIVQYDLRMQPSGPGYQIEEESLIGFRDGGGRPIQLIRRQFNQTSFFDEDGSAQAPVQKQNSFETSLAQTPWDYPGTTFREHLASSSRYHALSVEPRSAVRLPQPLRPVTLPGKDGEDLVSSLFYMRETDRNRFDAVEDALRAAFPSFERLDFPPVAAGMLAMTWREKTLAHPLYMHQLSEGTLRFLWLATLLQSPGLPAVTLIDEPEVSLHPELLSLLAELMREASSRTQLIVATHADRLVRFLEPKEVVVMDVNEDGSASAKWGDELDLGEWLKDYTLDEVWRMGVMRGRS